MGVMRKTLFIAANLAVLTLASVHLWDSWQANRFAGVGGPDEYRRAKYEQIERLRGKLDHLPAEIREAEEAAIAEQLLELETGAKARELGGELRRIK